MNLQGERRVSQRDSNEGRLTMKLRWLALAAATGAACTVAVTAAVGQGSDPGTLQATLLGAKEVDAEGTKGTGDRDGRGGATAVLDGRRLCIGVVVKNIAKPVQAHIHRGGADVAGPVVVTITAPRQGDPGAASGCVALRRADARAIAANPGRFYVNVHTGAFPNGAVRGQLVARSR
jgi:CHRD domain